MEDRHQIGHLNDVKVCEICKSHTADFFCSCSGTKQYFCNGCFPSHSEKFPRFEHRLVHPNIEYSDVDACEKRSQAVVRGRVELQHNLVAIDEYRGKLISVINLTIQELNEFLSDQLSQLSTIETSLAADLEESVKEAEYTITEREVSLRGKYSDYLRNHEPGSLILFQYHFDLNFSHSLRLNLPTFTFSEPGQKVSQPERLVRFKYYEGKADGVKILDFLTETWSEPLSLSQEITFNEYSTFTGVGTHQVFCCGFNPATAKSEEQAGWLIDFISGQVELLHPLRVCRSASGVLHYEGHLFVFGRKQYADCHFHEGNDFPKRQPGKEVERLQLSQPPWTPLPSMSTGRAWFTPCVFKKWAYLCTAKDSSVDILDLQVEKFLAPLFVTLPFEEYHGTMSLVLGNEILMVSENYTTAVNLYRPEAVSQKHKALNAPQSMPVKHGDWAYWVDWGSRVLKVSEVKWVVEVKEVQGPNRCA